MTSIVELAIEANDWRALDAPQALAEAVVAAAIEVAKPTLPAQTEVSIVLCDDMFIADLNRRWRGIAEPTNVLAFPSGGAPTPTSILGDIVIAYETTAKEAAAAAIPLRDHVAHLVTHGFLHLVGYDHIRESEAEVMEGLEVEILAKLEIPDPYGSGLVLAADQK
jgi:probable rRNA maturation factor